MRRRTGSVGVWVESHIRWVGAIRFAIGVTIGLIFVAFQITPESVWVVITIVVVMSSGPHTGGVLDKGMQRGIATALGCGLGLLFVILRGPYSATTILILGVVGALIVGYYLADPHYKYIAMYTCISFFVVISVPPEAQMSIALWRIGNIFIGGAIAIVIALVVFPESARVRFISEFESTTQRLGDLIQRQSRGTETFVELIDDEEAIVGGLRNQKATLASTRFESLKWRQAAAELNGILDKERLLLRHLVGQDPEDNRAQLQAIKDEATAIFSRHDLS